MKYVIMCGGEYRDWDKPRSLYTVKGEPIVARTIRLLQEAGATDIAITAQDSRFEAFGVPVLHHDNSYSCKKGEQPKGYWLDAFYPDFDSNSQVTFIFGDVIFTPSSIKTIVQCKADCNMLFGTGAALNINHYDWGEPFAYRVVDYPSFMNGISEVKRLYDKGEIKRHPIVWELYRYLNGFDINIQNIDRRTYCVIDDETMDTDSLDKLEEVRNKFGGK